MKCSAKNRLKLFEESSMNSELESYRLSEPFPRKATKAR